MVYVMPNLTPPITTVQQAISYRARLQAIEPKVTFLMSLYLHSETSPKTIKDAKAAGITGVKSYPAGVTTNSDSGVVNYEDFYPVFAEMEKEGLILNLHGECPSSGEVSMMNAEQSFLPTLMELHHRFPNLRIVLEHCTTAEAIERVKACGPTVAGTITPHHLFLTIEDVLTDPFCFCKPVAKFKKDRTALLKAVVSNDPKFFLGSDSAPHPAIAKRGGPDGKSKTAAGVFTQPYVTQLVFDALDEAVGRGEIRRESITAEILSSFLGEFGRQFYRVKGGDERVSVRRESEMICNHISSSAMEIVPFRRGLKTWTVDWIK